MGSELVTLIVSIISAAASGGLTFLFTKRKYDTEVDAQKIQNISESFDTFKKVSDATISSLNERLAALQRENDALKKHVNQLQMQMVHLMGNIVSNKVVTTEEKAEVSSGD